MLSVKKSMLLAFALMLNVVGFANDSQAPLARRIFQWPNFCYEHLVEDPVAASSHEYDYRIHALVAEEEYYKYTSESSQTKIDSCIDKDLLEKVAEKKHLIPEINGETCNHIFCTSCNKHIKRHRKLLYGIHEHGCGGHYRTTCHCDCTSSGIELKTRLFPYQKQIVDNWVFCDQQPVWNGYFQKYRSPHFNHFEALLELCEQNPVFCNLFPENSQEVREILDTVFAIFLNLESTELTEREVHALSTSGRGTAWERVNPMHSLQMALSHSFLYSQLKEALEQIDPIATYELHTDSKSLYASESTLADFHKETCSKALDAIRAKYLGLYVDLYLSNPHPVLEQEIRQLAQEMESM